MSDDDEDYFVTADQCAMCAGWAKALRPTMRWAIDDIPLRGPVCEECMMAFLVYLREEGRPQDHRPRRKRGPPTAPK